MSVGRLLLSGFLVASGLILGAFTLHGYVTSQWQLEAATPRQLLVSTRPDSTAEVGNGFVAVVAPERASPSPPIKAGVKPANAAPARARAAAAKLRKRLADKKLPEKKKNEKPKEQAAPQWPWSWLSSN